MDVMRLIAASNGEDVAFRTVVDAIPAVVWSARADGRIDYVNRRWLEAFGPGSGGETRFDWRHMLHEDDVALALARWTLCLSNGGHLDMECRLRDVLGHYRWYRISALPLCDVREHVMRWYGTISDIHENRLKDERLRLSERQFRAIADSIPQMIWVARPDGAIEYLNAQFYDFTGDSRGRLRGWSFPAIIHAEDRDRVLERWQRAIEAGEPYEDEVRLLGATGEYRWFLTRGVPVKDHAGSVLRWFGSCTDVTEQHEEAERTRRIADAFQSVLLPQHLPSVDGLRFAVSYTPAYETAKVGGDWYDAFTLDDGSTGISIGDVMGHGTEASVMMGMLRQRIFAAAIDDYPTDVVLQKANRMLLRADFGETTRMASAMYGRIDTGARSFRFSTAGHPPGIIVRNGRASFLPAGDPVLGSGDVLCFRNFDVPLEPGTVLVFYTDGLTEFRYDMLGEEARLLDIAAEVFRHPPANPALHLKQRMLNGNAPHDDIAILTVEVL